jgi:hypothetical protein
VRFIANSFVMPITATLNDMDHFKSWLLHNSLKF